MLTHADRWVMFAVLSLAASGCATTPPPSVRHKPASSATPCTPCAAQTREVEQLRTALSYSTAEVRELRSAQRVQVKVLQASRREVTRAKVKLRRLATRVDAASYIAEVEVAIELLRSSRRTLASAPQLVQAQRLLDSTAVPFAQEDYALAMDRAAEAEQLMLSAAEARPPARSMARTNRKPPPHSGMVASRSAN
jgi:hypothetical protein